MNTVNQLHITEDTHTQDLTHLIDGLIAAILFAGVDQPLLNSSEHWQVALELLESEDCDATQVHQLHALAALIDCPAVLVSLVRSLYGQLVEATAA